MSQPITHENNVKEQSDPFFKNGQVDTKEDISNAVHRSFQHDESDREAPIGKERNEGKIVFQAKFTFFEEIDQDSLESFKDKLMNTLNIFIVNPVHKNDSNSGCHFYWFGLAEKVSSDKN